MQNRQFLVSILSIKIVLHVSSDLDFIDNKVNVRLKALGWRRRASKKKMVDKTPSAQQNVSAMAGFGVLITFGFFI